MAQRKESRAFGNFMNLQLRLLFHQTFGIIDAQIGNPVAEIHLVDTLYIFRQIGAVGAKLGGQVAQGDSRLSVALIVFLGPKDLSSPKKRTAFGSSLALPARVFKILCQCVMQKYVFIGKSPAPSDEFFPPFRG